MRILILVLSYDDKNIYRNFYETQKSTWDSINVSGVKTLYYFGNNDKDEIIDNTIKLNVSEDIMNCGYKTIKTFDLIKDYNFDYIFRTNSSSYVDKIILKDYISNKPKNNFYSGIIGNHNGILFSSGCGYFLSKDVVNLILDNKSFWNHDLIDDVSLGKLLSYHNIYPQNSERFDIINKTFIPTNYFHYRLKTKNRMDDINNMNLIFKLKCNL